MFLTESKQSITAHWRKSESNGTADRAKSARARCISGAKSWIPRRISEF